MGTVSKVYTGVRGIGTAIKDVGRLREILGVLSKHGFGAAVTRLGLTETVGVKSLMDYTDEHDTLLSVACRIRLTLEQLGPTFVKLGQILSTRSDLLPPDIIDELQHLQDDVPPMQWDDVRQQIVTALGGEPDALFATFDTTPLACASIAQVHRATLKDGTSVVVKVQRTEIAKRIESDLHILYVLASRAADLIPELGLMDPVGIAAEFDRAITKEIDFRNERDNIVQFQRAFADFDGVRIPEVYRELTTERVLTMGFIEGVKVTDAPAKLNVDPYVIAPRMLRAVFKMIFRDGFFHGDLHPGNILIAADESIGLIDFGLVGRLTETQRDHVLDILIGISREDYALVARTFYDACIKLPGVTYDYGAFESDVVEVMQRHISGKTLADIDIGAYFSDLVSGAIRHNIKMPPTYTMVFKALITVQGIGQRMAPDVNLIEEAKPFVQEVLAERYSPRRLIGESVESLSALSKFLREFPIAATPLLRDASEGRLTMRMNVEQLNELNKRVEQGAFLQSRSLAFAGCMVAASLALPAEVP
ncbi:MAG: ubiquinone biosynthesis protein, partial [Bradymonadia bacterium]